MKLTTHNHDSGRIGKHDLQNLYPGTVQNLLSSDMQQGDHITATDKGSTE